MSEYESYYSDFGSGYWCDPDPAKCRCHGSGWALSELDTWHRCPVHFNGQTHPEYESCPECGDGANYPPDKCSICGKVIQEKRAELDEPGDFNDIPF